MVYHNIHFKEEIMKKAFSVIFLVLCLFVFVSCENDTLQKAPAWLAGKTWAGDVTLSIMGESGTQFMSFSFDEDGNINMDELPESVKIIASGNNKQYKLSIIGTLTEGTLVGNIDYALTFTKIDSDECKLDVSIKMEASGSSISGTMQGTLKAI